MIKEIINGEEVYFTEPSPDNIVMGRQLEEELLGKGALYQKLKAEEETSGTSKKKVTKPKPQRKAYKNVVNLNRNAMSNLYKSIDAI
jgi:hypothetical protein